MAEAPSNTTVPSPCINICCTDEITGYCKGCFRTLDEIASWPYLSDNEKRDILTLLSERKAPRT
jgi:predicted Fe-S protein YdhL (DUF1289 family)